MQTNAPGRGKLKVTGILYIIFGALGPLLSLALLAGGGLLPRFTLTPWASHWGRWQASEGPSPCSPPCSI